MICISCWEEEVEHGLAGVIGFSRERIGDKPKQVQKDQCSICLRSDVQASEDAERVAAIDRDLYMQAKNQKSE